MKNVHLNRAFRPTPPCIRAAIERGFEQGEKRMRTRYRFRTAFIAAAAALLVCGIGLTALHTTRPSPDRVQYAHGTTVGPLTAVNASAGEEGIIETPFSSAADVAAVHTLPFGTEEAQNIVLAQPEVAAAGASVQSEEFTETTETTAEPLLISEQAYDAFSATPKPVEAASEQTETPKFRASGQAAEASQSALPTPRPIALDALATFEPIPVDASGTAGTLQFSIEEAIFNDDYGFLLLRCSFDSSDWMQVTTELPRDAALLTSNSVPLAEISPVLDRMLGRSFNAGDGLRFAQMAVPEVLLPDGTRPLATRVTEGADGSQELLVAYIPDPKHNIPEYVNINLYLNGFLVNANGECLAAYSKPVPLAETDGGSFTATGEPATEKAGTYMQDVPIDVPVTRVRGGYAARSGISHYWISGFGDWILFQMRQDYDPTDEELQKILDSHFILMLADGTQCRLPISRLTVDLADQSAYWQVSALLSAGECRTGDPAICRVTTLDEEFLLSDMLETDMPLALALEKARLTERSGESIPPPTPEPVPAAEQSDASATEPASEGPTASFSTSGESDGPTAEFDTSGN